jgi:hypothetical protein
VGKCGLGGGSQGVATTSEEATNGYLSPFPTALLTNEKTCSTVRRGKEAHGQSERPALSRHLLPSELTVKGNGLEQRMGYLHPFPIYYLAGLSMPAGKEGPWVKGHRNRQNARPALPHHFEIFKLRKSLKKFTKYKNLVRN